ncbi:protein CapI [Staphylococcus gallinarum]|jgi:UDP-glucuronate 4-epimerase|uniref:NAD-dependent epimerase n=1 Tax=Staphylococcus gallinarum TaxID=1293 RepID=UPI000D1E3264|nr:NAD-dependent epimerase [Staphylococcus gallinarum]MCD8821837.1 NAD-dependent epimerase [Staphylococcus gallinarum]PTL09088.1 protein CapI [Staphylococcus gallinarum]PTL12406.1 protein CapI [Staphylococcus gallinarum]RIL33980.1 NAD-dependent epimerase [Staphylococcus gallinarum]RIO77200.1 NAD-dependent epimerase [Staphylococcus gallinarum]
MKILITGAAGFIGSHLAKKLIAQHHEVIGVDNINDYYSVSLKEDRLKSIGDNNFTFYKLNLEDYEDLKEVFIKEQPEVVVNLAAQAGVRYSLENPRAYIDANVVGFMNILECSRHFDVKHLIYASSSSVYGANTSKPFSTSDNIDHPLSLYAATKKSNELMAHTYSHLYQLPTTGLRFFTVYGPWGRPDMALFKFTKAIVNDEAIDVYNHGNMMRDFTYVDDIVEAISRLIKKPAEPNPDWSGANPDPSSSYAPYKVYNIGNNSPVRLMEFVEAIENKLGKTAKKNYMDLQAGDVPETYANVDDLYNNIDFKPETSIQDGVNKFIDWYLNYYK